MSSARMGERQEKTQIFEMIFSSPGMLEKCKVVLHLNRQNLLLLSRLIESGFLSNKIKLEDEFLQVLPECAVEDFKTIHMEILKKAGLTDFYEKLKLL